PDRPEPVERFDRTTAGAGQQRLTFPTTPSSRRATKTSGGPTLVVPFRNHFTSPGVTRQDSVEHRTSRGSVTSLAASELASSAGMPDVRFSVADSRPRPAAPSL